MQNKMVLVVPTYNEDASVIDLCAGLEVLKIKYPELHVIFVDDSPNELTVVSIETELRAKPSLLDSCKVIRRNSKQGRGSAVKDGFLAASQDGDYAYFLECDADGSHDIQGIADVIASLGTSEFVIGSRYLPQSRIIGWPFSRRVFSRLINIALRFLFRVPIQDFTNGLRGYSRDSVSKILRSNQMNKGFIYLTEQILILEKAGIRPVEIPITFRDRKKGKSSVTYRELLDSIIGVVMLRLKFK